MPEIVAVPDRDDAWRVGDVEFVAGISNNSTRGRFSIQKDARLIGLYKSLCPEFVGARIVELGIADGGSTALLALALQPSKLVACDIEPEPRPGLTALIDEHDLADAVRPCHGIDQADASRLSTLLDVEFGDEALDLVIDDASHRYEPTVRSFEVLFPRLRPDGLFVVEDWAADHYFARGIVRAIREATDSRREELGRLLADAKRKQEENGVATTPLSRLALELMLASVFSPHAVASVSMNDNWLSVRRGDGALTRGAFRVLDLYADHFGWFED
ncbi:MAG: hypothetical protein QOG30_1631 [Acidimicrobiaceae bacterium]